MIIKKIMTFSFIFFQLISSTNIFAYSFPKGNGTWIYDSIYNEQGKKIGFSAGLFVNQINNYNLLARPGNKINMLFSYGGDMEMYCQGSGESSPEVVCNEKNMLVFYDQGALSTQAYHDALAKQQNTIMVPIVDGRLDQDGSADYLKAFNRLDRESAYVYANKVAALYCADDKVAGVQFDIEPFDIDQQGQAYFYEQIAKNFAGKNNPRPDGSDPLNCVNSKYPQGRFFSIFTFAKQVNKPLADILNRYNNGFVIDSLYDLGLKPGGELNTPTEYKKYVAEEVGEMMRKAKALNISYQFAIAAAASAHEFESKAGKNTGIKQLEYVKAAIQTISDQHAKEDPYYVGTSIWAWNDKMIWQNMAFTPAMPDISVTNYLQDKL